MKQFADGSLNMALQPPIASDSSQHLCLSLYIKTTEKIKDFVTNSERHFTWVTEVLEIARQQVASQDVKLLPKTPSAKRARCARKKTSSVTTDDETTQPKKKRKNGRQKSEANEKLESISETDLDSSQMSTRSTRSTRATRSTANRSTRSTRNTKKTACDDTDSTEQMLDISKNRESEEGKNKLFNVKEEVENVVVETSEKTEDAQKSVIMIEEESDISTPKAKSKLANEQINLKGLKSTPKSLNSSLNLNNSRSSPKPIPGFRGLNVKGKAEAYNQLIKTAANHSDVENTPSPRKASKRLQGEATPKVSKATPETPPTILKKTEAKITLSQVRHNMQPRVELSRLRNSPNTPRTIRASPRRSLRGPRKSLSQRKSSIQQRKSFGKQSRFVKKVAAQESESKVDAHSECEAGPSSDSSEGSDQKMPVRTTRSKMCVPKETPKVSDPSSDEDTPIAKTPEPPRRTRSKMRINNPPQQLPCPESTEDEDVDGIDKTPKSNSDQDSTPSTLTPLRTTRSKMRKLQEKNQESPMTQIKPAQAGGKKHKRGSVDVSRGIVKSDASPPKRHCPDSECPATPRQNRYEQETAKSVLNGIRLKSQPKNLNTVVTSFIKRNTPVKMSVKDKLEQRQKDLEAKGKKDEDRIKKRKELLAKKAEEQRRRREEKEIRFAKRREENLKKEMEQRKEIAQKLEESKNATVKLLSEKIKEEQEKQKLKERKIQEAEMRRKNEEEARKKRLQELEEEEKRHAAMLLKKKEQEEQERQRKLEEQKRQQDKLKAEQERERLREEEKKRQFEEQRRKEEEENQRRQERERKERAERERLEIARQKEKERQQREALEKQKAEELRKIREQMAAEKLKQEEEKLAKEEARKMQKTIENHNKALQQNNSLNKSNSKTNLNTTQTKPAPTVLNTTVTKEDKHESYEITPRKIYTASSEENYGIDDIHSDDSTDEEDAPRKIIPKWATGSLLKAALINQHYHPPNLDDIFDTIAPPDLNTLFVKKRPRFNKRTSSAVWDSPIMKPSVMHR